MSENLRWYTKAIYNFDHVVRLAPAGSWAKPSPCPDWSARDVLGHVNAIQRLIEATIEGREPPMNPMVDPGRHAGPDPAVTWAATRDAVLEALDHPGVLHRVVRTFRGEETVDHMIGQNIGDTTVHSWDLARALGVDDRLDPGLAERTITVVAPRADAMREMHMFGPRVDVTPGASAQTRLLALTGRAG